MLLQTTIAAVAPPFHCHHYSKNLTLNSIFTLPKTPFLPLLDTRFYYLGNKSTNPSLVHSRGGIIATPYASLLETPVLWAGRLCIFYALLKAGLAGSPTNPLVSDLESGADDLGFSKWFEELSKPVTETAVARVRMRTVDPYPCSQSGELYIWEKDAADRRKLVSKWHPTTKGTLRRNYRVPSKSEGKRLLRAIASLLSDDDQFRDATSHKGCQIRRENAHGESVCCNNVRALFDELPTPHLIVEITPFPVGPLTENDYSKAERLERVLRSGPSV